MKYAEKFKLEFRDFFYDFLISQEVQLSHCVNISDDSIEALLTCCPRINILIFDGCPNVTDRSRQALEEVMLRGGKMKQLSWTVY